MLESPPPATAGCSPVRGPRRSCHCRSPRRHRRRWWCSWRRRRRCCRCQRPRRHRRRHRWCCRIRWRSYRCRRRRRSRRTSRCCCRRRWRCRCYRPQTLRSGRRRRRTRRRCRQAWRRWCCCRCRWRCRSCRSRCRASVQVGVAGVGAVIVARGGQVVVADVDGGVVIRATIAELSPPATARALVPSAKA